MHVLAPNNIVETFPYSVADLKRDNPQTSFPANLTDETLATLNVFPVVSTGAQYDPATEVAEPNGCVFNTDKQRWETAWSVRRKSPDEITADVAIGKAQLLSLINAKRDQLETEGFPHAGLWFQSDERSVARLSSTALTASAALMAGQSPAFPDWIAADNTPLPVDAAGMLSLQAALTQHAGALHQHARGLKTLVLAAETVADLDTIDIEAGWPGQQGGA